MRTIFLFLLTLFAVPGLAIAQETTPDAFVKNVSDEVLAVIRSDKDLQSGDTRRAMEVVEAKVLPHFNFNRMTALAVGRDWRQATPEQQKALADEFKTLLVRTYSNALTAYKNHSIEIKPTRSQASDTEVTVRTQVNQPGGKPVTIDYSLEKSGASWKVYDVVVGGVSLVTNYREAFATEVRSGGIDGLLRSLQTKNRGTATSAQKG